MKWLRSSHQLRWAVVGLTIGSVIVQLVYPWDRAFLGATLDGEPMTFKTKQEISSFVTKQYQNATLSVEQMGISRKFTEAGIDPNESDAANAVVDWPWWQRIIPFSSVWRGLYNDQRTPLRSSAASQTRFAKEIVESCNKPAVNATVAIDDAGNLSVKPSVDGRSCDEKTVLAQLRAAKLSPRTIISAKPKIEKPKRSNQQVEATLNTIRPIVTKGITVKANDKTTTADAKMITSWLTFDDGDNGKLIVDVDLEKMRGFIDQAQSTVYIAPGTTHINTTDGVETSRTVGANGQGVDQKKLAADIRDIFSSQSNKIISAKVVSLPPKEVFNRNYTNTTAGLQALLDQLAKDKGDVAIAVTELGGQGRKVSANGSKQYHPASTYKLVMAYSVMKRIESNQMKWDDQIAGKSVDACLSTMIVESDNTCAEAFGKQIGWSGVQADVRSLGMGSTNYESTDFVSTANDQALFLVKLQSGTLMKNENKDKLLELMKRQRYRSGVPAGVSAPVADKVGFMGGLLHDSAIVYGSHTYVISVYSNGASWGAIADIARQVNNLI